MKRSAATAVPEVDHQKIKRRRIPEVVPLDFSSVVDAPSPVHAPAPTSLYWDLVLPSSSSSSPRSAAPEASADSSSSSLRPSAPEEENNPSADSSSSSSSDAEEEVDYSVPITSTPVWKIATELLQHETFEEEVAYFREHGVFDIEAIAIDLHNDYEDTEALPRHNPCLGLALVQYDFLRPPRAESLSFLAMLRARYNMPDAGFYRIAFGHLLFINTEQAMNDFISVCYECGYRVDPAFVNEFLRLILWSIRGRQIPGEGQKHYLYAAFAKLVAFVFHFMGNVTYEYDAEKRVFDIDQDDDNHVILHLADFAKSWNFPLPGLRTKMDALNSFLTIIKQ